MKAKACRGSVVFSWPAPAPWLSPVEGRQTHSGEPTAAAAASATATKRNSSRALTTSSPYREASNARNSSTAPLTTRSSPIGGALRVASDAAALGDEPPAAEFGGLDGDEAVLGVEVPGE